GGDIAPTPPSVWIFGQMLRNATSPTTLVLATAFAASIQPSFPARRLRPGAGLSLENDGFNASGVNFRRTWAMFATTPAPSAARITGAQTSANERRPQRV